MKKCLVLLLGLLINVALNAQLIKDSGVNLSITNKLDPNLIKVTHTAGNSAGNVTVTVVDGTKLTGDNYCFYFTTQNNSLVWNIKNVSKNIDVVKNLSLAQPFLFDGLYAELAAPPAGIKTDDMNSTSDTTKWGWNIKGTRRFAWTKADPAGVLALEAFGNTQYYGTGGSLGWTSPYVLFVGGTMTVKSTECKKVLLKLANVNYTDDWGATLDTNDPNVSYGYRYLRKANVAAAETRFTPFIKNAIAGTYPFQAFEKNVPLSAWNIDDPANPKRLAVGFVENNVVGGLVDGVYWPAYYNNITDNFGSAGPREWLFIFDEPYSETADPTYQQLISSEQARVMYMAVWNRRQNTAWSSNTGTDQLMIYPNKPFSETDIYFIANTKTCSSVQLIQGWNLISLPLLLSSMNTQTIFPDFTSQTYGFSNGLKSFDNLSVGNGYWLKYSTANTVNLCGQSSGSISVPVVEGWNLIGPYNWNVNVSNISTSPASILTTPFYGYNNGYSVPTLLEIGKGYWVKSSSRGVMNLNVGLSKSLENSKNFLVDESWNKIIIRNSHNESVTLYSSFAGMNNISSFEMPPMPPREVFDCRYSSNRLVENLSLGWKTIEIQSNNYPVKFISMGVALEVRENEEKVSQIIDNNRELVIVNPAVKSIQIRALRLPTMYSLEQNYPNPFNPETIIKYQIPNVSYVTLKVYDVLGREIVKLVDQIQQPGIYQSKFNATNSSLSSGVYFYRLQAGEFLQTKKMIIAK